MMRWILTTEKEGDDRGIGDCNTLIMLTLNGGWL
jgi:hypothetical protein